MWFLDCCVLGELFHAPHGVYLSFLVSTSQAKICIIRLANQSFMRRRLHSHKHRNHNHTVVFMMHCSEINKKCSPTHKCLAYNFRCAIFLPLES